MDLKSVCVFCSSSPSVPESFRLMAESLGEALAMRKITLVYGGGKVGLMGVIARAVQSKSGKVVGVIPDYLVDKDLAYHDVDELIVTETLRQRKAVMESRSDAFIVLPGGFGTMEEVLEILTLKQLGRHRSPIVFLNVELFFEPLMQLFEQIYHCGFALSRFRNAYYLAENVSAALAYLEAFQPADPFNKFEMVDDSKAKT